MNSSIHKTPVVLLTGANGFIGTYIARELLHEKNMEVFAMVKEALEISERFPRRSRGRARAAILLVQFRDSIRLARKRLTET